jgi:hypothetical protein
MEPMVHYHIRRSHLLVPVLSQMNPINITSSTFSKPILLLSSTYVYVFLVVSFRLVF